MVSIRVYIPDETYAREHDDADKWEAESTSFRSRLEEEHKLPFERTDIGTGSSDMAYVTTLVIEYPLVVVATLFFAGKKIEENIDAWMRMYDRLKAFLSRRPTLDRTGAASVAIKAIIRANGIPNSMRLMGYCARSTLVELFEVVSEEQNELTEIEDEMQPHSDTIHVFQVEFNDRCFKAFVFREEVKVVEIVRP